MIPVVQARSTALMRVGARRRARPSPRRTDGCARRRSASTWWASRRWSRLLARWWEVRVMEPGNLRISCVTDSLDGVASRLLQCPYRDRVDVCGRGSCQTCHHVVLLHVYSQLGLRPFRPASINKQSWPAGSRKHCRGCMCGTDSLLCMQASPRGSARPSWSA